MADESKRIAANFLGELPAYQPTHLQFETAVAKLVAAMALPVPPLASRGEVKLGLPGAKATEQDRYYADMFLARYGEGGHKKWEHDDLAALVAGVRIEAEASGSASSDQRGSLFREGESVEVFDRDNNRVIDTARVTAVVWRSDHFVYALEGKPGFYSEGFLRLADHRGSGVGEVTRLKRRIRAIVDSWERWVRGDLSEEEFTGTVAEAQRELSSLPAGGSGVGEGAWAVAVLDAWAALDDDHYYVCGPQYYGRSWYVTCWHVKQKRVHGPFTGESADAARVAAARALSEADPSLPAPPATELATGEVDNG